MYEQICQLARHAGDAIMKIYLDENPAKILLKSDQTPVTEADIAAHHIIVKKLQILTPTIPILSEENPPQWENYQHWHEYWLVDPLDGTKEFIKRNGEFTVNIALIKRGKPIMGVVYAPVKDTLYLGIGKTAWKETGGQRREIKIRYTNPPLVLISRSHPNERLRTYLDQLGEHKIMQVGSSLKFCLIAEGSAQLYPRFGPTNIWDTAAGDAVVSSAGAVLRDWEGNPLDYSPRDSFLNPDFCVSLT